MKKSCSSIGVPTWTIPPSAPVIQGFTFCTDAGPDVSKARKLIHGEADAIKPDLSQNHIFDCNCFTHQLHLIDARVLKSANLVMKAFKLKFSFAGSLAMTMNIKRQYAKLFFILWQELLGKSRRSNTPAASHRKPPKECGGHFATAHVTC